MNPIVKLMVVMLVASVGMSMASTGAVLSMESLEYTDYTYEITTSPVDPSEIDDSSIRALEDLPEEEQVLFKEAFEESEGSILEGDSVTVDSRENVESIQDWSVISIKGKLVVATVSVSSMERHEEVVVILFVGVFFGFSGMMFLLYQIYSRRWNIRTRRDPSIQVRKYL